jgi:mono/diheme cytochrome c family protein
MKKVLKWFGILLGALVGLLVIAALVLYIRGNGITYKTYSFPVEAVTLPTDAVSLEHGKHLASVLCSDCHGGDYSGIESWFKGGPLGTIDSANLTAGEGGVGAEYKSVEDYVRAIRHGVNLAGKPVQMPAVTALTYMSDEDLGALIAYLKTLPPVDHVTKGHEGLSPLAYILTGVGMFNMPAAQVDHTIQHVSAPSSGVTTEYGKYLATINHCNECHGTQYSGGRHPDPSVKVYGPNLTPAGELVGWSVDDFIKVMRTGLKPGGGQLSQYMPWPAFGKMTDDELKAIWLYLQGLPAEQTTYK